MEHSLFEYLKRQPTEKLLVLLRSYLCMEGSALQKQIACDLAQILRQRGLEIPGEE